MGNGVKSIRFACSAAYVAVLAGCLTVAPAASAEGPASLLSCPTLTSADQRLLMEQWAPAGNCRSPTRTRVIDRFLGYSCLEEKPGNPKCRAYVPGPESRAFDTAKHYRCIDLNVTASDEGIIITQMREWIADQPRQCDWDPNLSTLAVDIDFGNSQVCISGLCLPTQRLSIIGKLRLRQLIERAFRELGLLSQANEPAAVALTIGRLRRPISPR